MTNPVRISGFFSTFDTEAVIQQLRAARELSVQRLEVEEARAIVRRQLIADIGAKMSALLSRAKFLTAPNASLAKTAGVAGSAVSAAAGTNAALGSFEIDVLQLATGTTADGTALSLGVDSTAPLTSANFAVTPTEGTYTVKTATGGSATLTVGEAAVDNTSLLSASNFATAVTDGNFTVATQTGGTAVIAVDTATQSLDDVINAINTSGVGLTASITNDANGRANIITLTSTQGDITLGDAADTSNFLAATNLESATGTTTLASTEAFTTMMTLDDVVADINGSGIGLTATITNDGNGRPNLVTLNSTQGAISLGNANDTSNILSATNLLASPGTTTRESTASIARLNAAETMDGAAFFGGPPASGQHFFTINGVQIDYDTATDSLNDVISRINASGAGVTARYNAIDDRLELVQTATGSLEITLADDGAGGDFLSKTGLLTATQTLGQNAEYAIDGGATQYAATNTVSPLPGVTMTLLETTEAGSPETVTVTQNSDAVVTLVKNFVTDYNAAVESIDQATHVDPEDLSNSGELSGDATIRRLKSSLRSLLTGRGVNVLGEYDNFNEIGLGFGDFGSDIGTTDTLKLDEAKFIEALENDPASVQALLETFSLEGSLDAGGTGSISGLTGTYSGAIAGRYTIVDDGAGNLTSVFRDIHGNETTTFASVVAGGTETTLIPGMTLQIAGTLQAGEHTITVSNTAISPMRQIQDFLEAQAGSGDVLANREETYSTVAADIRDRIETLQGRIDAEMERLRDQFILMEQAQARADAALGALQQMTAQLASINGGGQQN